MQKHKCINVLYQVHNDTFNELATKLVKRSMNPKT